MHEEVRRINSLEHGKGSAWPRGWFRGDEDEGSPPQSGANRDYRAALHRAAGKIE